MPLEFLANFTKVVNLSVVNNPVAGDRVVHGLMAKRREVENGEAAVAQADFDTFWQVAQNDGAAIVGAAVGKRLSGALQNIFWDVRSLRGDAEYSAHKDRMLGKAQKQS